MAMEERIAESERIAEEAMAEVVRTIFRRRLLSEAGPIPNYLGPLTPDSGETHSAPSEDKDDLFSQLKTHCYNGQEDDGEEKDDCCICLERLHRGLVATLHCRHEFHGCCIGRWLNRGKNFCPLCKGLLIKSCSSIACVL
ncbi:receptor homology region, transmembrane domain- and RING domain-containing protein 6-like [Salvia splendens]|nr:receptor homology region, transmembrane domain- and RING domain-containing protein 6-like [Salvia splendens]